MSKIARPMHNCGRMRDGGREHCDHYYEGQACCQCGYTREIPRVDPQHRALVEALKSVDAHLEELQDAWERGALESRDGKNALRSNINRDVLEQVRQALRNIQAARKDGGER